MKLYAQVLSDRAGKAQGGNKYVRVFFTVERSDGSREPLGDAYLTREGADYLLTYCAEGGEAVEIDRLPYKKGENVHITADDGRVVCRKCHYYKENDHDPDCPFNP